MVTTEYRGPVTVVGEGFEMSSWKYVGQDGEAIADREGRGLKVKFEAERGSEKRLFKPGSLKDGDGALALLRRCGGATSAAEALEAALAGTGQLHPIRRGATQLYAGAACREPLSAQPGSVPSSGTRRAARRWVCSRTRGCWSRQRR
jgi:hypothetical protein